MLVHSKDKFFLFSQGSLRGIILEFGFLHIPNYVLCFSTNKGNSLCIFISRRINGNYLMHLLPVKKERRQNMHLNPVMNEWQLTYLPSSENSPRADFLGGLFLGIKYGRRPASPPTNTWLLESEALPRQHHPAKIERVGERDSLSFHYSVYYYRPLILARYHCPLTDKCIRVSYFLVTVTSMKGYSTLPRILEFRVLEFSHYQMQFSVITSILLWVVVALPLCRGCSRHILKLTGSD